MPGIRLEGRWQILETPFDGPQFMNPNWLRIVVARTGYGGRVGDGEDGDDT